MSPPSRTTTRTFIWVALAACILFDWAIVGWYAVSNSGCFAGSWDLEPVPPKAFPVEWTLTAGLGFLQGLLIFALIRSREPVGAMHLHSSHKEGEPRMDTDSHG
jgi:hypothetical protein